jgi:hypothetical protein
MRRPLATQVSDIGIWSNILEGMTYLAVGFNVSMFLMTGLSSSASEGSCFKWARGQGINYFSEEVF